MVGRMRLALVGICVRCILLGLAPARVLPGPDGDSAPLCHGNRPVCAGRLPRVTRETWTCATDS